MAKRAQTAEAPGRAKAVRDASVSVIMPAYNHERYVEGAIRSVVEQTLVPREFLIIDDGSTDRTPEICARYAEQHPFIDFRRQPNMGVSRSSNLLLDMAEGSYVALLASDDAYMRHKLETQVNFLESHPEFAAAFSRVSYIDGHGAPIPNSNSVAFNRERDEDAVVCEMLVRNVLCATSCVVRRSVVEEIGYFGPELVYTQDYDYWLRILSHHRIAVIPEVLSRYRWHQQNLSASNRVGASAETSEVLENRVGAVLANYPVGYSVLDQIKKNLFDLSFRAKRWDSAAGHLEAYRQRFATSQEDDFRLLSCYLKLGRDAEVCRLAYELYPRRNQFSEDRRATLERLVAVLERRSAHLATG